MSESEQARGAAEHRADTTGVTPMEGESVLYNRHPWWNQWWIHLTIAAVFILAGISAGVDGASTVFIGLVIVGYVVLVRQRSRYIVTDERIKHDVGLQSNSREYRISDLQGIDTSRRLFGLVGDISMRTADRTQLTFKSVRDHDEVAHEIRELQRQYDETMDRKYREPTSGRRERRSPDGRDDRRHDERPEERQARRSDGRTDRPADRRRDGRPEGPPPEERAGRRDRPRQEETERRRRDTRDRDRETNQRRPDEEYRERSESDSTDEATDRR